MNQNESKERSRRQAAEEINRAMSRFPLIIEVLGELRDTNFPLPGDGDLSRGCERALTSILGALTRIQPGAAGRETKTEEIARNWLSGGEVTRLVDADQLQRMHQVIESVLGADPKHH